MATSFDLFGTLVMAPRPAEPWDAVAVELARRDVPVPDDWESAYRQSHQSFDHGEEISLIGHTSAALASRDIDADREAVRAALLAAFDGPVERRDGVATALAAAADAGPVGILSNCSLPGLVERTLASADFDTEFDAVVTSVGCGWRKPHDGAFHAAADALGVETTALVHVGDDPRTDGGGRTCGVEVLLTDDVPLSAFPSWLEERCQ